MINYNAGDKVVIRKDLEIGNYYGDIYWGEGKEHLKEKEYVVIELVDDDGDYLVEYDLWYISIEMIEGLYEEPTVESIYYTDKFKQALDKLNKAQEKQQRLINKYPDYSKEYRKALREQIKLKECDVKLTNAHLSLIETLGEIEKHGEL